MNLIAFCQPLINPLYAESVHKQILSGWLGPGPLTDEFSKNIASYVGSNYALLTTSGTIALSVAAQAVGLNIGDEILVPAYGVVSTINAFSSIGLKPRLVDIEIGTGCMSPYELKKRITKKTKAVCFVDFSGYTGENLVEVAEICQERKLYLIEDAACALGQRYKGKYAGTFGDVGIYSFSIPKIITTGQGGALVTNVYKYYRRASGWIDHGGSNWRKTNVNRGIGTNLRFNDVLSSLGLAQLKEINKRLMQKKKTYTVLHQHLGSKIFSVPGDIPPLHHIVFIRYPKKLVEVLKKNGIMAAIQYRTISQHLPYRHLADSNFPNADFWTNHAVFLPFGLSLSGGDASRIVREVEKSSIPLIDVFKGL